MLAEALGILAALGMQAEESVPTALPASSPHTASGPAAPRPLAEPLSERERDVLRLLAAGLPNAEIARQLYVEVSTVKRHLKAIYGKLGAHSREQAMARARELQLLPA